MLSKTSLLGSAGGRTVAGEGRGRGGGRRGGSIIWGKVVLGIGLFGEAVRIVGRVEVSGAGVVVTGICGREDHFP